MSEFVAQFEADSQHVGIIVVRFMAMDSQYSLKPPPE